MTRIQIIAKAESVGLICGLIQSIGPASHNL